MGVMQWLLMEKGFYPATMESEMDKNMENQMEPVFLQGVYSLPPRRRNRTKEKNMETTRLSVHRQAPFDNPLFHIPCPRGNCMVCLGFGIGSLGLFRD